MGNTIRTSTKYKETAVETRSILPSINKVTESFDHTLCIHLYII